MSLVFGLESLFWKGHTAMKILGIDLGKFESVACTYQSQTATAIQFQTRGRINGTSPNGT
jgi:hypothetical protein